MATKQDSNSVGLRYAEETAPGVVSGSAVWYPVEPNGYKDMGGQLKLLARDPINASRQRTKGVITDLDASGGFDHDFTQDGLTRLLQGFVFADIKETPTNVPMNEAAIDLDTVTGSSKTYTFGSGTLGGDFAAGDLILVDGCPVTANNGLKTVASTTDTTIVVTQTCADDTVTAGTVRLVGHQFGAGEVGISSTGLFPRLVRASGAYDFSDHGLVVGEWIFIGGDATGLKFATAANNGFARIRAIDATYLEFDKASGTMATEAAGTLTIQVFYGNVLKNAQDPDEIVRRTYQLERTLGDDGNGVQTEYIVGATPNEMSINIKMADKVTAEFSFLAMDNEQRSGTTGDKDGTRPDLVSGECFNTSSDIKSMKLAVIPAMGANPTALFSYLTEMTITLKNNCKTNKAVAVLGAFDVTTGTFEVGGNLKVYFADTAALAAVRANSDVTFHVAFVKANAGWVFDLPLLALGDGKLDVAKDEAISLPLSFEAAKGAAGHTLLMNEFPYLPALADS